MNPYSTSHVSLPNLMLEDFEHAQAKHEVQEGRELGGGIWKGALSVIAHVMGTLKQLSTGWDMT